MGDWMTQSRRKAKAFFLMEGEGGDLWPWN